MSDIKSIYADPEYKIQFRAGILAQMEMQARRRLHAKRPEIWAKDILGVTLWSKQIEVAHSIVNNHSTMVAAGHGVGKLLLGSEVHPTPSGWVKTSDITVGTQLYDERGIPTTVTALSPWWDQDIYRITFDDGETIDAGENHEWDALDLTRRSRTDGTRGGVSDWRNFWHTSVRVTTKQMHDNMRTTANQLRWKIPNAAALQMPEAELPLDPYLLGFWLGDGTATSGDITIGESKKGAVDIIRSLGFEVKVKELDRETEGTMLRPNGLRSTLAAMGLLGNKRIPMAYLRASEPQRRALLAGLMDSDGFLMRATGRADVGIDLTNKDLFDGLAELVRTLGYSIRVREGVAAYTLNGERHETGKRYRATWTPNQNPFRIRGDGWSAPSAQASRHTARTVKSIEKIGNERSRCIEVDSPSHLYLAGRGMIPTHNSYLTAVLACWWIDTHPIGQARVLSTAPTTAQVRGIVWREIQLMHRKAKERYAQYLDAKKRGESTAGLPDHPLPGYITSSATWRNFDGLELGSGRTPPAGREGDAFQGIHGGVFAIADEAVGVNAAMIDTLQNNTTANDDRILMIANPTNPKSAMGETWNDPVKSQSWTRIKISVLDSPHFTDEGKALPDDVMKFMTDKKYVEAKKLEYGEDSANYKARVMGEWAMDAGMIVFLDETIETGKATLVVPDLDAPINVGFDVAYSEKGDWSYLYTCQEGWVYQTHEWAQDEDGNWDNVELPEPRKTETRGLKIRYLDRWRGLPFQMVHTIGGQRMYEQAANERVQAHMESLGASWLRIDADGMGGSMVDAMIDARNLGGSNYEITRIKGNDPSPDRNAWYNNRAYTYMELARRMRNGEVDIEPDDAEGVHPLCKELGVIEYKYALGMAESILILSKKELRSKKIKSPDAADSANYASMPIALDTELPVGTVFTTDYGDNSQYGIWGNRNSFWG